MTILAALIIALGLIGILIGILAWARKLPGNSLFGLRVPAVRKSKKIWEVAHSVAGPYWLASGISLLFAGLLVLRPSVLSLVIAALTVLLAAVFAGMGANMGSKAAHLLDRQGDGDEGCGENCNCGDTCETPKPEVDVDALRKAME